MSTTNGQTTQFLIFQDGSPDNWRIASTDARLSKFSGLYPNLDTAVSLLEEAGVTYRVIRFEDVPVADSDNGWIAEIEDEPAGALALA